MPATIHAINASLDYDFGRIEYTSGCAPATYYIGLSTSIIDSTGSTITEPSDSSYMRIPFTNNKTNWAYAEGGSVVNLTAASFVESSKRGARRVLPF